MILQNHTVVISTDCCFEPLVKVFHVDNTEDFVENHNISLVNSDRSASLDQVVLRTFRRRRLHSNRNRQIMTLIYKFLKNSKGGEDFTIDFNKARCNRQNELNRSTEIRRKCDTKIQLKDIFVFAEHKEKSTFVL